MSAWISHRQVCSLAGLFSSSLEAAEVFVKNQKKKAILTYRKHLKLVTHAAHQNKKQITEGPHLTFQREAAVFFFLLSTFALVDFQAVYLWFVSQKNSDQPPAWVIFYAWTLSSIANDADLWVRIACRDLFGV